MEPSVTLSDDLTKWRNETQNAMQTGTFKSTQTGFKMCTFNHKECSLLSSVNCLQHKSCAAMHQCLWIQALWVFFLYFIVINLKILWENVLFLSNKHAAVLLFSREAQLETQIHCYFMLLLEEPFIFSCWHHILCLVQQWCIASVATSYGFSQAR